jgi:Putative zinc-finger/FecR protein
MKAIRLSKHVTKYLSAYCHGELTDAVTQTVRAHLAACDRCQKEYETIKRGIELAGRLTTVSAPARLWGEVREKLEVAPLSHRFNWPYAWLVAAAVLFIGLSGWFLMSRRMPEIAPPEKIQITTHRNHEQSTLTPSVPPSPTVKGSPTAMISPSPKVRQSNPANVSWEVASLTGTPRIGDEKIRDTGKLGVGEWLETDNDSTAKIKVAEIGYVDIDPNSRVQLVRTKDTEHRIALAQGKLSALILAPPRLFIVETPSATAVDLGCAYTLEVDASGGSLLQVTSGWVSFVHHGRETFIPAGANCRTRKGGGVGTPYFEDASAAFKAALAKVDFGKSRHAESAIHSVLVEARVQDALTLWHLLGKRTRALELRGKIYDRLTELTPPPQGVTRQGILKGNEKMLDLWWEEKIR